MIVACYKKIDMGEPHYKPIGSVGMTCFIPKAAFHGHASFVLLLVTRGNVDLIGFVASFGSNAAIQLAQKAQPSC